MDQVDVYGATVADRVRRIPALLGTDLGDALDEPGAWRSQPKPSQPRCWVRDPEIQ